MNWPGTSTILVSQGQQHLSTRGQRSILLIMLPTVPIHPVPVHIPMLAIVVTRGKGGDASSLVQLSTVFANKRQFTIGVIRTVTPRRPPIEFLPFPCAIWFSLIRRQCLPLLFDVLDGGCSSSLGEESSSSGAASS